MLAARRGIESSPFRAARPGRRALLAAVLLAASVAARPESHAAPDRASGALLFEPATLDLGTLRQEQEVVRAVVVRNGGTTPIERLRCMADCGCYEAALGADRLAPGATTELTIRFRTLTFSGRFSKHLRVHYEDPEAASSLLRIDVAVTAGVVLRPGRLHLGNVRLGEKPRTEASVVWYEGDGQPFSIRSIAVPGVAVETSHGPWTDPRDLRCKGFLVTFRFLEPFPRGTHHFEAVIATTDEFQKEVRLPISAIGVGRLWLGTERLSIGVVPRGVTRTATVALRALESGFVPGRLEARAPAPRLRATIEAADAGGDGWILAITVPEDAPEGPLDDVVEILTDIAGEERLTVRVLGHVAASATGTR